MLPSLTAPPDISTSPLYLLAVLFAARRSKDRLLESVTRRHLTSIGVDVFFGDELLHAPQPTEQKERGRG